MDSASAQGPVILKKYGNRRIYDARQSGYVTLEKVEAMVQQGEDVQVIDAKSGEDLTNQVLVQIILERASARDALPTSFLKQVVRLSNSPLKESFSRGLQGLVDSFVDAQRSVLDAQRESMHRLPQMASNNPFLQLAMNPFQMFAPPPARPEPPPAVPRAPDPREEELRLLREQLASVGDRLLVPPFAGHLLERLCGVDRRGRRLAAEQASHEAGRALGHGRSPVSMSRSLSAPGAEPPARTRDPARPKPDNACRIGRLAAKPPCRFPPVGGR